MKYTLDTESKLLAIESDGEERSIDLYSKEAFDLISEIWLKVGWNQKYPYSFSWMGRPIIQNPEEIVRTQEVIYRIKPTVIVETGVAHGGSLIYYASLFKAMGTEGRVIGVDIEIRPHNRTAIEAHELFPSITLIEGSSTDPDIVSQVATLLKPDDRVLVILDSNHTKAHVAAELAAYHGFVTPGSYIVATDGSMEILHDVPRGNPEWLHDNPSEAAREFAAAHPEFILEQPEWPFNESQLDKNITHWPDAWLKKL
ncbi:CmcI family methyltransferase [Luteolibacter sp. LG18]|uniref:cephalosporin hydroxylase family protein n=1 Tax=Luteolibacter sp. LG18 TaxID=2819286 RepID=UPI002B304A7C|nr:hydroxylase [Luteolibacter sp. LG18]